MDTMIREFELQEKNMLLLRNPYLSVVSTIALLKSTGDFIDVYFSFRNNQMDMPKH